MSKIKKEELEALVNANRVYRDLKFNLADIEMSVRRLGEQKELTMQQLETAAVALTWLVRLSWIELGRSTPSVKRMMGLSVFGL